MADNATRQHYDLATGGGQKSPPSSQGSPGFKKGGRVKPGFKRGGQNLAGSHGHSFMVAGKKGNC
jgi:hypothetical protein